MNAPLTALSPIYALIIAAILNVFLCRQQYVARALSTPLALAGRSIDILERRYNRAEFTDRMRRNEGLSALAVLLLLAAVSGAGLDVALSLAPYGWVGETLILTTMLTHRIHYDQSLLMSRGLRRSLEEGRATLAWIAGYDALGFNEQELAGASTQLAARSLNEGVVAPVIWYILFGLPGIFVFKAVNIAHHMIDERAEYSSSFGWAPARLHEILLFPASPIAAVIAAVATIFVPETSMRRALEGLITRLGRVISFENGPVTLAMAAGLGVSLPLDPMNPAHEGSLQILRRYRQPDIDDIANARRLFVLSVLIFFIIIGLGAAVGVIAPVFHLADYIGAVF